MSGIASVFDEVRSVAEGRIACECGNNDWMQFVYVGAILNYIAACKKCARSYMLRDSYWVSKGGPYANR